MSDNNDETIEIEIEVGKFRKAKQIVSDNRKVIGVSFAIGFTGGFAFVVGRKTGLLEVDKAKAAMRQLDYELDTISTEVGAMWEFIDHKKLGDAYSKYREAHALLS